MTAAKSMRVHVQQQLFKHGGKRKGAGRKPTGHRAGARHDTRPKIDARQALHVVLRVVREVGSMRRLQAYIQLLLASWRYREFASYVDVDTLAPGAMAETTSFTARCRGRRAA